MTKALFKLEQKNTLKLMLVFSILVGIFSFVIIALYPTLSDILNQLAKENAGTELEKLLQITNVGDYFTSNMLEIWSLFAPMRKRMLRSSQRVLQLNPVSGRLWAGKSR